MKVLITQHQYNYFMLYEATLDRDRYYYNLADDFYMKMIVELEKKQDELKKLKKELDDLGILDLYNPRREAIIKKMNEVYNSPRLIGYINDYGEMVGNIAFDASEINQEYNDLLIIFTDERLKGGTLVDVSNLQYTYGSIDKLNKKVIVIGNLTEDKNPVNLNLSKKPFIHEFIHYLDYKRSGRMINTSNKKTFEEYYNSPREFNAYYQESATYLAKMFEEDDGRIRSLNLKIFSTFDKFYKWAINQVFDKNFIKYLNETNRRKLINRLYNIYSHYLIEK